MVVRGVVRVAVGVLVVGVCAVLVGCAAEKSDVPGFSASPRASATASVPAEPTPAPSPTSTEVTATDLSDPDGLGIVFVDTPDLTGPVASAHDAVAIFEQEWWRSYTTGSVSPLMVQLSSPTIVEKVRYAVQRNVDSGYGFDGVLRVTISEVTVDGSTASAIVCKDYTDLVFTRSDGSPSQDFAEAGAPQFERTTVTLSTIDGGVTWQPQDFTFLDNSC